MKCDKYTLKSHIPRGFEFNEMTGSIYGTPEERGNLHFEIVCFTNEKQYTSKFELEGIILYYILLIYSITKSSKKFTSKQQFHKLFGYM